MKDSDLARLLLGNAGGFHLAASRMTHGGVDSTFPWPPFFANIGFAIELSLKAYVIHRGGTLQHCKDEIRHDLKRAVESARAWGMHGPNEEVMGLIARIGRYHRSSSFRYMTPIDVAKLPGIDETLFLTNQLLLGIANQVPELLPT